MQVTILPADELRKLVREASREATETSVAEALASALTDAQAPKTWLTNREAQEYLGLSRPTLQRYRSMGILPYSKIEGSIYYKRSDLEALLESRRIEAA